MAQIDYYFTPLSPFTYLAGLRLEEVAKARGAEIAYKPFNLAVLGKETGFTPPPQRHPSRQAYRLQELTRIAAEVDLPINLQPAHWPTNPVPASVAIIAAVEAGGGDVGALVHGLMGACWAEEKDIAEDAVLAACLEAAGFDGKLAGTGMLSGVETLERYTNEALEAGVFGSPTYVVGEAVFWGQDRIDALDRHLA
ncbi:MAG: 2-hydroxychromene-2-carboxylate isomerase [Pseudomonadota bacterium]